uniref:Ribosomal protein L23 n=1 Tax=Pterospora andromedea TaxID=4349 RepID=A0A221SRD1_PTEAN|nr:ribosomal protein L23 [Pterospora andromedea]
MKIIAINAINSHFIMGRGRRMGRFMEHTMHCRRMIIMLRPSYSTLPLIN